jgi:hypothetical protein
MKTAETYFKEYSELYQFEEGSPEYLLDKEDFIKVVKEYAKAAVEEYKELLNSELGAELI